MNVSDYFALCGAMSPLGKLTLASDLAIALAYFAIPVGLMVVWRKRLEDLPYPWMFGLFAAFIVACGLTHLVHAIQMPWTTFEHTAPEAATKAVCALLSVGTAIALIAIMPKALKLISPRERGLELEREVANRTRENQELVREVHHRLGNQLQVMNSALRLERRRLVEPEQREVVARIQTVLDGLVAAYHAEENRFRRGAETLSDGELPRAAATGGRVALG